MRPAARLRVFLVALLVLAPLGCSNKEDRILSNKRLLRGEEGLGTTTTLSMTPDQDTYVGTALAVQTQTMLTGTGSIPAPIEAQAFYSASSWNLLPASIPVDSLVDVVVDVGLDGNAANPAVSIVALSYNQGPFDSTYTLNDPAGPRPGTTLAQDDVQNPGALRFSLTASRYADVVKWAARPDSFPGFAILGISANGIVHLDPNQAFLRVIYRNFPASPFDDGRDTVSTWLTRHFSLRSALVPAPTGSDSALVLGGEFDAGLLVRFPPLSVPNGSTVNEATLRLRLDPSSEAFDSGDSCTIFAYRVESTWPENATTRDGLTIGELPIAGQAGVKVAAGDSLVALSLPPSVVRLWALLGSENDGVLILVRQPYHQKEIRIRSRESSLPMQLRVSYTSPPPARF